ncbi:DCL family protein [Nocardiopsis sp. SBT366]|uniref:DCL family protein n=1 Tax=Nocardiopsis sp. SBT366 TaxID=1580529 RepID=UPI00066B0C4D|nr:DCL family protein [Nocardiopsis sp. SBT366]
MPGWQDEYMASQAISVGDRWFPSKSAATKEFQRILRSYDIGTAVTAPRDEQLLLDLVQMHTDPLRKIGSGIERFEVRVNPQHRRNRSLFIVRSDGTEDDFGYTKLIQGQTISQRVTAALRHEVRDQIEKFRTAEFAKPGPRACPIEDTQITHPGDCHVDHEDPGFRELVQRFVDQHEGWGVFELYSLPAGEEIGQRLKSRELASQWHAFHAREARLRIVSVKANLSTLRKGTRLPG